MRLWLPPTELAETKKPGWPKLKNPAGQASVINCRTTHAQPRTCTQLFTMRVHIFIATPESQLQWNWLQMCMTASVIRPANCNVSTHFALSSHDSNFASMLTTILL